jgi:hypothetical protein
MLMVYLMELLLLSRAFYEPFPFQSLHLPTNGSLSIHKLEVLPLFRWLPIDDNGWKVLEVTE